MVKRGKAQATTTVAIQRSFQITDFPPEIFSTILSHAYPSELLNLSRSTKPLRKILLARSARPIWKRALKNLGPLLPPCPPHISEPQYSHCIFGMYCYFCSAGPTKRYPLIEAWDFRFHVCNDCFTARDVPEFESDSERLIGEPELNFMIRYDLKNYTTGSEGRRIDPEKVPCVEKRHHYHSSKYYLCTEERERHEAQLAALPTDAAREEFETEKVAALQAWRKIKDQKDVWKKDFDEREKPLTEALLKQRQEHKDRLIPEMKRRILELGWDREVAHDESKAEYGSELKKNTLWNIPAFEMIGEGPLSPTVWDFLLPKFLHRLKLLRIGRINEEASFRLSAAVQVLDELRDEFSVKHYIVPHDGDLFKMKPIQDAIFRVFRQSKELAPDLSWEKEEIQKEARKAMEEHLPGLIDDWVEVKKREIYALVPVPKSSSKKDKKDPNRAEIDTVLNLATTLFPIPDIDITYAPYSPLTPTQLLAYHGSECSGITSSIPRSPPRGESNQLNLSKVKVCDRDSMLGEARDVHPSVWSCSGPDSEVRYFAGLLPIVECVVRGCGMDPGVATHGELRGATGVAFRCGHRQCYEPGVKLVDQKLFGAMDAVRHWVKHYWDHYWARRMKGNLIECKENEVYKKHWNIREVLAKDAEDFVVAVEDKYVAGGLGVMEWGYCQYGQA